MTSDANPHQRSSSPLKRRASSMDPDADPDVNMAPVQSAEDADNAPPSKAHLPRAMSVDLPDNAQDGQAGSRKDKDLPPLEEQIKTIQTLLKAFNEEPPKAGDVGYIVSKSWVEKALALGGDPKFAKKEASTGPLGPVDNSDLILETIRQPDGDEFVRMNPGTSLEECEIFPEDAWTLVSEWYGVKDNHKPIVRHAVNLAVDAKSPANIMFELNPPIFTVHRLWSLSSPILVRDELKAKSPLIFVRSAMAPYNSFFKELKEHSGILLERKMRVWQITEKPTVSATQDTSSQEALTPPDTPSVDKVSESSIDPWQRLVVEVPVFANINPADRLVVPAVDNTGNPNYNGSSPVSVYGLTQDMTLVLDEEISKNQWVSNFFKGARGDKAIPSRGSAGNSAGNSGRTSPVPGPVTRGRTQQKKKPGRGLGIAGLQNLGNTCYMNSALQCVRSVEELTKYFLTDEYQQEINKTNPLGYKGQVAMAYGGLLKEIYAGDSRSSVSPRDFKNTVGRARSTFQGWGQQDTQEFLGFLLDALQEDLNRVKAKPYIEKPDSTDEMIGDEEAIRKMAEEVWDITRKRDDSVVADLFTGLYKSTVKCPVCDKVSITFDPFTTFTCPLPVEDMWSRTVKFFPLNDAPVEIEVELSKHSAIEELKKAVAHKTGVHPELLLGAEEFKGKFFKVYDTSNDISEEIQSNDIAVFHELSAVPTNFPPKKVVMGQPTSMLDISEEPLVDPRTEQMVVTVLHRKRTDSSTFGFRSSGDDVASPPHFIVLTRDEACKEDVIRRKILEKVATFSTWSAFSDADDTDPDMVIASQSDADSSGDAKVVTNSVEGEDDMVNVSVDTGEQQFHRQPLKEFSTIRPKWVKPEVHLPARLQNLFELSYFSEKCDNGLPTGWNSVDDNKSFRTLASRAPENATEQDSNSQDSTNSADSEHESVGEEPLSASVEEQTRMADESDGEQPVRHVKNTRGRGGHKFAGARRKVKNTKTYGKRGKRRAKDSRNSKEQSYNIVDVAPQPSPEDNVPGGPLVRLGEGIVVDWTEESWDMVFGSAAHDAEDTRGERRFVNIEKVRDSGLEQKRKSRATRKKQGITLEECLDEFQKAEVLSEHDQWYCPRCKDHRRASKKFDLWKTPDILIVHLKRFSSAGWRRDKLDVLVDFPTEGLDLHKRVLCQETGKKEVYDLIAVDDHFGGLGGGHYTASGRNFVDGQWYNYNDSHVTKKSAEDAVTRSAYLLFYRRRSDQPLGGPRFKEIFDKYDKGPEDGSDPEESGEDQRLVGGSSLTGSSRHGNGAGATLQRASRGLASSTTPTTDLEDDSGLPSYEGSSSTHVGSENIHNSIEDEAIGMTDYLAGPNAYQAEQTWNFSSLNSTDGPSNTLGLDEYASDDAQPDLSDRDGDFDQSMEDVDDEIGINEPPPPPDFGAQVGLSEIQNDAWKSQEKVHSVPAADDDVSSTEAAEIHLDDEEQRPARS